jgi:pyruvate dehydrogenase E2 component (dihydrolipoamide acetyltransferase)
MSQLIEVKVPDIGDFADVPVIELFVKVGDTIKVDDAIATLESDKATMDVPSSPPAWSRKCWSARRQGRRRRRADQGRSRRRSCRGARSGCCCPGAGPRCRTGRPPRGCGSPAAGGGIVEVKVPDIGDFSDVPVIELFVKVGDSIKAEDAIATLESDKATMDVPSSATGVVKEVLVQLGSKVSEGAVLIKVETGAAPLPRLRPPAPAASGPPPRSPMAPRRPRPGGCSRPGRRRRPPSSSAARCTPARRCVPLPANWASISPRSRPPARRTASSRPTSPPSSRAP